MSKVNSIDINSSKQSLKIFAISTFIASLCDSMLSIVIVWGILAQHEQLAYVTLLYILYLLPRTILSPFFGILIDKLNKKKILMFAECSRFCLLVGFSLLFSSENIVAIYVLAIFGGIFLALYDPCVPAFIKDIMKDEDLLRANSMLANIDQIAVVTGPLVGGILVAHFSFAACLSFIGLLYLVSAIAMIFIPYVSDCLKPHHARIGQGFIETYRYLKHENLLSLINLLSIFFLLTFSTVIMLPIFSKSVLHASAFEYGALITAMSVGFGIGNSLNNIGIRFLGKLPFCLLLTALSIFSFLAFMANNDIVIAYLINFTIGFSFCLGPILFSHTQASISQEMQGRAQSFLIAWQTLFVIIYYLGLGIISEYVYIQKVYIGQVILSLIIISLLTYRKHTNPELEL